MRGRKRVYDKIILDIFQQHKLRWLRFNEIHRYLRKVKPKASDVTLNNNLKYLIKKNLVYKFEGNLYCLIKYAVTIQTKVYIKMMYELHGECPKEDVFIKVAKMYEETFKEWNE